MSIEIPTSFYKFRFTEQESAAAAVLTSMQKQHIHNLRADVAEELLNIEDDVENPLKHVQERAKLQGQLDAYAGLINLSESAEEIFRTLNQGS